MFVGRVRLSAGEGFELIALIVQYFTQIGNPNVRIIALLLDLLRCETHKFKENNTLVIYLQTGTDIAINQFSSGWDRWNSRLKAWEAGQVPD